MKFRKFLWTEVAFTSYYIKDILKSPFNPDIFNVNVCLTCLGKYTMKKSRRTDVEDLTPNPRKLLQIGNELRKLNKVISDLTPVSELPLTARPRSRKEKNKLASR